MSDYMCSETQGYLYDVMNYAMENGVTFLMEDRLSEYTPSAANPSTHTVLINSRFHDPYQIPYQAAHEVEHVLMEHSGQLYFNGADTCGQEGEANRGALKLLVPMYFADIDADAANPYTFMKAFSIPGTMYDYTVSAIQEYYS